MRVKVTDPEAIHFTVGKVYDVIRVDHEGDIWVTDDDGHEFFLYPDECVYVDACPNCKGTGTL